MIEKNYDIVIVGSGASGAVMGKELAPLVKDGVKIAILEWGPKLRKEDYTGGELEMVKKLYFEGGGILTKDRTITIALGKAYGGSTVVYTGTTLTIPKDVLEGWEINGLEFDDIEARSKKYYRECNAVITPPEFINENNRLFKEGCEKLGYLVKQFPVNIKNCEGASVCNLGCPHDAKQGTHVVQLPEAEKNGVEVITNCQVKRIGEKELFAYVVNVPFGYESTWEPGEYKIKSKLIILCAGAIHSPTLLQYSGIGKDMPVMGKYITLHPALILMGQHERPITNFFGHPKCYYTDHFHHSHGFIMETCMYFPFMTAKSLTGFGQEHADMVKNMDKLQQLIVLAFDKPLEQNRIYADKDGKPVIDYTLTPEVMASFFASQVAAAKVLFAAGAKKVHAPAGKKFFIEDFEKENLEQLMSKDLLLPGKVSLSSAHIMGGCKMGSDKSNSITNQWGQVHGHPWLFVGDSSIFPKCSEVNPYITIMALADRNAQYIREHKRELLN